MITEQLEFRIAQYADGTLPASEVAALESELATSAEARARTLIMNDPPCVRRATRI